MSQQIKNFWSRHYGGFFWGWGVVFSNFETGNTAPNLHYISSIQRALDTCLLLCTHTKDMRKKIRIKIIQRNIRPTFQAREVRYVTGILWWAFFVLLLRNTEITPGSWKNAPTSKAGWLYITEKITLENFCYFSNPVYIYKLYFVVLQCHMLNMYVITWLPNSRMLHQNIHLHTTDVPFPKTYN